ncbi:MAG: alpha/beta hydrolase [Gemmataceae bacterium]
MAENSSQDENCQASHSCPRKAVSLEIRLEEALARFDREASHGVCPTPRYQMPYYSWGNGPPLVFIHGVSDISRSFLMVISRLSAHFRCIAYNLPLGNGDGARLHRYQHEDLVDDLARLLDHLQLSRTYLLGSSFGSTIALRALRRWPDRIPRGILQGGLARRPLRLVERLFGKIAQWMPVPTSGIPRRTRILEAVHRPPFAGRPPQVWEAFVTWTGESRLAALGHQARLLHRVDLRPDLPHIQQPVLLLHGDRDSVMPRYHAEMLLRGLPRAGLVILEGAGHVPYYTHPEAMTAIVRQFLTPPGREHAPCPGNGTCEKAGSSCSNQGSVEAG